VTESYTRDLANYAAGLRYEDIPPEVVQQAKQLTLHVLAVSLAACQTAQGKDAISLAKQCGGSGDTTIIGDGAKVACTEAAFANGTLADLLDWEDCSWTGHPSAGAITTGLAMGESLSASGKDYITAIVAAYEVYQRIAMAVQPSIEYRLKAGWGLTSWQIFASAMPAAKLLNLDAAKMAQAIGIAAVTSPIVNGQVNISRSDMYHYEHGISARNGIHAALIANQGINGLNNVLDGDNGYWVTVTDNCEWDWMTRDLGDRFLIMETLCKRWPVNMWIQQYMDGLDLLMREENFSVGDVEEIIVSPSMVGDEKTTRMAYRPEGYRGSTDAQFSIPFCFATILLDPQPGAHWFAAERLCDAEILGLAGKIKAAGPEVITSMRFKMFQKGEFVDARTEVRLRDGRSLSRTIGFPKGHPRNMFTLDEHKDFFVETSASVIDRERKDHVVDAVYNLENIDDIGSLMRLLH
jgi:2-methylcitrate dehydratase PrpD